MESRRRVAGRLKGRFSVSKLLIVPFWVWLAGFVVGPLFIIIADSFSRRTALGTMEPAFIWDSYALLFSSLYGRILLSTLAFASANTVICLLLALPLSFFISRLRPSLKTWALVLVLIPFWTSFLVRILSFMELLRLEPFGIEWIYTAAGVLSAMVYNYLPFAILPLYASMSKIENSVLEAARDLGASRRQVALQVVLPLVKPGRFSAALFVFVPSLGEFLIPELVGGGHFFLLGSFLQNQFLTARNWPLGSATIVLLVLVTLAILVLAARGRESDAQSEGGFL